MIKIIVIIIILVSVLYMISKINCEHFHEVPELVTTMVSQTQCVADPMEDESMIGCSSTKDFNPEPEKKDFILSRCLLNHTTESGGFKDDIVNGCPRHQTLCESSGCKDSVNYYWKNLETLKSITDVTITNRLISEYNSGSRGKDNDNDIDSLNYDGLLSNCSCNYEMNKDSNQYTQYKEWLTKITNQE